ncbi:hypothetical protein A2U01_0054871, partial [Trifolium medium]|nr:hypothetical protein [Trifolium medium]
VGGSPRELWGSMGMRMKEEYSLKRKMGMEMMNFLDDGTKSDKVSSAQIPTR